MFANEPLARNSYDDEAVPVILEEPANFPFAPGERESDWHVATEAELAAYDEYWLSRDDA